MLHPPVAECHDLTGQNDMLGLIIDHTVRSITPHNEVFDGIEWFILGLSERAAEECVSKCHHESVLLMRV